MSSLIRTQQMLLDRINQIGILPFFKNRIPGWSLEEQIDPAVWFTSQEGPWEWKGQMAADKSCVYSKVVRNGNAWVSLDLFPDLANYRRDGYDYEGLCEDGLIPYRDRLLMDYLLAHGPMLSKAIRTGSGITKGYDTSLTRLEMQTLIINQNFVYNLDKNGRPYGWGNALLTTPEQWFGESYLEQIADRTPSESLTYICSRLAQGMPEIPEEQFRQMLR